MRCYRLAECVLSTLHEVASAAAVRVYFDAARQYVHAFDVDERSADNGQVAVGYFQNLSVADQDGTILQPPLWGEDAGIDELSQHRI